MGEALFILFGVVSAVSALIVAYPLYVLINLKLQEKKVKMVYLQIKGQVDIKCDIATCLKNKGYDLDKSIQEYATNEYDLDLKYYNDVFNHHILKSGSLQDIKRCNEAEEKINCTRDYYNEVVCSYNRYKSSKVSSYLAKSFSIEDAKLY